MSKTGEHGVRGFGSGSVRPWHSKEKNLKATGGKEASILKEVGNSACEPVDVYLGVCVLYICKT